MSVRNPKTRLICFRLSQNEYERLQALRNAKGVRSLSGFVRGSMSWIVDNCDIGPHLPPAAATQPADGSFSALTGLVLMLCRKTDSLDQEIRELMIQLKPARRSARPGPKPATNNNGDPET